MFYCLLLQSFLFTTVGLRVFQTACNNKILPRNATLVYVLSVNCLSPYSRLNGTCRLLLVAVSIFVCDITRFVHAQVINKRRQRSRQVSDDVAPLCKAFNRQVYITFACPHLHSRPAMASVLRSRPCCFKCTVCHVSLTCEGEENSAQLNVIY